MRDAYHEQLDRVTGLIVAMTREVAAMITRATNALLDADIQVADGVVAHDVVVNRAQEDIDEQILQLIATQGPVAGELRMMISGLRISADLERMGDLATHIAKVARMRYPESAVPVELHSTFRAMGEASAAMARKVGDVVRDRDEKAAATLEADDDEMDRLHRSLFLVILDHEWPRTVETAVDLALLGRYYERYADHAVTISGHVSYLISGTYGKNGQPSR